jgi:glycosyltransferase involved in cell wall biosynthesis
MTRRRRIVVATGIYPPSVGGPATYSQALADELPIHGIDVRIATFDDVRHLPRLVRHIAYGLKLTKAAVGVEAVYAQDPFSVGAPAWLVAFLLRRRFVLKVVGDFAWEQAQGRMGYTRSIDEFQTDTRVPLMARMLRAVERFVARRAVVVVTPSEYLKRVVTGWGVPASRITVINNSFEMPVDVPEKPVARAEVERRWRVPADALLIVSAGRLVPWKGFDRLIKAVASVRRMRGADVRLVIAGDGPHRAAIERAVTEHEAGEWATLTGSLPKVELFTLIRAADCFALDTEYEGLSHQLLEVRALGTPIVTTDVCGNPELVENGVTGRLVRAADTAAMADAIKSVLDNPDDAGRLADAAKVMPASFSRTAMIHSAISAVLPPQDAIKIVMLSTDQSIVVPGSRTRARLDRYQAIAGPIDVVVPGKGRFASFTYAYRAIAAARKAARRGRAVVTVQDPFEVGLIGLVASFLSGARFHVQVHIDFHNGLFKAESFRQRIQGFVAPYVLHRADAVRVVSDRIRRHLVGALKIPSDRVACVPIASDVVGLLSYAPAHDYKADYPEFDKIVVAPCRFVKQKNLSLLVRAFDACRAARPRMGLLLMGEGPERRTVEALIAKLGLTDAVRFLPWSPAAIDLIATGDVFALSSDYEGWGMTAVEAAALGTPVVMTDVGCAGAVIRDGETGLVVPVRNDEMLARAMGRLLDDQELAARLSSAAREEAARLPSGEEYDRAIVASWRAAWPDASGNGTIAL